MAPSTPSTNLTAPAPFPSPPCYSYRASGPHTSRQAHGNVESNIPDARSPSPPQPRNDFFLLINGARRVIVLRPRTYEEALIAAKRHFPSYKKSRIRFTTDALPFLEGDCAEISPDAWAHASLLLRSVNVVQCDPEEPVPETRENSPVADAKVLEPNEAPVKSEPQVEEICLNFTYCSQNFEHTVRSDSCWGKVFALFEGRLRAKPATLRFVFGGTQLLPQDSITTSGVRDGGTIEISKERRCAKFAICLTPAAETSNPQTVSVSVSLTHQWSFSSTFPTTPTSNVPIDNQRSEWKVELRPNGTPPDASATKPTYLFWEAHTNPPAFPPPTSPNETKSTTKRGEVFDPITADLSPANSVMLYGSRVSSYLDRTLTALDLHLEARESFINHWLPLLQRHQYIALRFIPHTSYDGAASLVVVPAPDVVHRLFMIFKGIELGASDSTAYGAWAKAAARADEDVRWWRTVVGLQGEAGGVMNDDSRFRVLEYGGMEAKPL